MTTEENVWRYWYAVQDTSLPDGVLGTLYLLQADIVRLPNDIYPGAAFREVTKATWKEWGKWRLPFIGKWPKPQFVTQP
jgi:hypothetical protein